MKNKNRGFIFATVVVIIALLSVVIMSVTVLSTAHSNNVINDTKKDKAYYIASSGLEIVYSALNEGDNSILKITGKDGLGFDKTKKNIIEKTAIEIYDQDGVNVMGYCDIQGDLLKDSSENLYYRVTCVGRISKDDVNSRFTGDERLLTMFIYPSAAGNNLPKIYDGYKESLD